MAKLRAPASTSRVLRAAGLPGGGIAVRSLGSVEVTAGLGGLAWPHAPSAVAVGALYLAFAGFLASLLVRHVAVESCGCLGEREAPPSWLHVALNVAAAAAAAWLAALGPVPDVAGFAWNLPLHGLAFVAGGVTAAYLAYLAVAFVPHLYLSYRREAAG